MITLVVFILVLLVLTILVFAIGTSIAILQYLIPALLILMFANVLVRSIKKWFK